MSKPGMFVAFEGPDGVGKTTAIHGVAEELKKRGFGKDGVIVIQDPGTSKLGQTLRPILKGGDVPMSRETQTLLFAACRMQMAQETILPALQNGMAVLCDRYLMSTIVYQVLAQHQKWENFQELLYRTEFITPSVYVVLNAEYETLKKRRLDSRWGDYFDAKETIIDLVDAILSKRKKVIQTITGEDQTAEEYIQYAEDYDLPTLKAFNESPDVTVSEDHLRELLTSEKPVENLFGQWKAIKSGQERLAINIVADGRFDDDEFQRRVAGCYHAAPALIPGSEPVIVQDTTDMSAEELVEHLSDTLMQLRNG